MSLNKSTFEKMLKQAKYQFILKTDRFIYFIPLTGNTCYTDESFVAHNETNKNIEIVDYKEIKSAVVDGVKYNF
ncbi:MAG: hypothetical protein A2W91_10720 [Bacteroidetes bacterium GWF2_38_335]|nr:MAG: hypothetical protein A2W91_10720 [Bacteroidetes bacterium GWF2_38_335]OFY81825.1 MAG: hypothetical protein A2281_06320 [Bacteroidetes bacterium RIFOXYA12_FULL_38_20]HBS87898.1 hypothetical protein [Bacteroidales bacterium]